MFPNVRRFSVFGIVITISLIAAPAWAAFNFTSQTRSITAHTYGLSGDLTQTFTAPDFALFDKTASVVDPLNGGGSATQSQKSELLPNAITIVGAWSGFPPPLAGTGQATGNSSTTINFDLATTTDVDLTAQAIYTNPSAAPTGWVILTGPSTNITWYVSDSSLNPGGPWPAGGHAQHLVLSPGSYVFKTSFSSSRIGVQTFNTIYVSSFDVALSIPEPASAAGVAMLAGLLLLSRRVKKW
jgi:hypothetical protein